MIFQVLVRILSARGWMSVHARVSVCVCVSVCLYTHMHVNILVLVHWEDALYCVLYIFNGIACFLRRGMPSAKVTAAANVSKVINSDDLNECLTKKVSETKRGVKPTTVTSIQLSQQKEWEKQGNKKKSVY